MASFITSPNMSLTIPTTGEDTGPDYANNINACFMVLDGHTHASGSGVPITPSALNINSDLSMLSNNLVSTRSLRFSAQSSPLALVSDIGCLYESGVDLYYNDGSGNQVRITQSGGVAGSPGSIASLASPASATYVAGSATFVWQSAANTAANMDGGAVVLRNITAGSKGYTLNPPNAMAADISVMLPNLPASQKFMTLDNSGNIGASWAVDNSTLEINSNTVQIKSGGVTTNQIANSAITPAKVAALGQQIGGTCGTDSTTNQTDTAINNMSFSITTTGRPVFVGLISDGSGNAARIGMGTATNGAVAEFSLFRGVQEIARYAMEQVNSVAHALPSIPSSCLHTMDVGATAGAHTYTAKFKVTAGSSTAICYYSKLLVYEIL